MHPIRIEPGEARLTGLRDVDPNDFQGLEPDNITQPYQALHRFFTFTLYDHIYGIPSFPKIHLFAGYGGDNFCL